jgi:hypothetical protein
VTPLVKRKKRVLSEAELAQRRAAARNGGRKNLGMGLKTVRKGIAAARVGAAELHAEIIRTLTLGMRGQLPESNAQSMQMAAKELAKIAGFLD